MSLVEGTYNFRDVGGLPLRDGGTVASAVLYRSDGLAGVTDDGLQQLSDLSLAALVDLRAAAELEQAPDRLPPGAEIAVHSLPLLDGAFTAPQPSSAESGSHSETHTVPTLEGIYRHMLEHSASTFAQVARIIAGTQAPQDAGNSAGNESVLVHCTAGKDRTGIAIALILDAVGVEREAIIADYHATERNLAGPWAEAMIARLTKSGYPVSESTVQIVTGAPVAVIRAAFEVIDGHGGGASYLRSGGLTETELEQLRNRLVA